MFGSHRDGTGFAFARFKLIEKRFSVPGFAEVAEKALPRMAALKQELLNGLGAFAQTSGAISEAGAAILYSLIKQTRPNLVIETGIASGFSSRVMLTAMQENNNGRLISIDVPNYANREGYKSSSGGIDPVYTPKELGVGWFVPKDSRERWQIMLGESSDALSRIKEKPDIFFHDSDHGYTSVMTEYTLAMYLKAHYLLANGINLNKAWKDHCALTRPIHMELDGFGISENPGNK